MPRPAILPLALLLACGATGDGTTGDTTGAPGTTGTTGTTATPTTGPAGTTTGTTTTTGDDDGTAGDMADLCEMQTSFGACSGAGCAGLYDSINVAADCTTSMAGPLCLHADGTSDGMVGPTRAYHREIAGQLRYLLWNDDGRAPSGWTECTPDPDAPPGCACLCDCPTTLCGQPGPDAC